MDGISPALNMLASLPGFRDWASHVGFDALLHRSKQGLPPGFGKIGMKQGLAQWRMNDGNASVHWGAFVGELVRIYLANRQDPFPWGAFRDE